MQGIEVGGWVDIEVGIVGRMEVELQLDVILLLGDSGFPLRVKGGLVTLG